MNLTEEMKKNLLKLPTGNIADNNNSVPRQGVMDSMIKPVNVKSKVIGRAYTAICYPGDNLALHQAIYAAQPGDVLVLDCKGYTEAGHFGDIMATACKIRGLAGVIIDGSCRDSEDIRHLDYPVFARAFCPAGTVKESLAKLGTPVLVGGVAVNSGDIIYGDCDGVVVIPQEAEDEVFAAALKKYDKEQKILKLLEEGKTTLEIYGFDKLIEKKMA